MKPQSKYARFGCALVVAALGTSACTAPPSAAPLLRVADEAMRREAQQLQDDIERDAQHVEQSRRALDAAFAADLGERATLDAQWVRDAAAIYATAREELVRHETALRAERAARAANLLLASEAQRRAIELIERQDQLITDATGLDLWRLRGSLPGFITTAERKQTP